ncbi:hypothetical protein TH61_17455 [Rufibacter sp. DG15C]|uniref:DUF6796 family protein n=1 Tax=Rufibacter sp. DG15C TaxID=1379909 RepID=UPI00078EEB33|nr:DUF6796 family protein [Rufibacter sp. DG15C]AMM52612.1 hypothetical protein TH61_17455 [Rufibacter sp. DG15C]
MEKRTSNCLIVIGLAGMLFAFGDLLIPQENVLFEATKRPDAFAELVTSSNYKWWGLRGFVGVLMEMIGTVGLYLYLQKSKAERLAFYGLLLTLTHHILGVGVFAVAFFMFPALAELHLNGDANALAFAAIEGPLGAYFALSLAFTLIGLGVMAVAVYRSGHLPRWSGWLAFVGFLLIPVPGVVVQFAANFTWGMAYWWMAYHIRKNEQPVTQKEMRGADQSMPALPEMVS